MQLSLKYYPKLAAAEERAIVKPGMEFTAMEKIIRKVTVFFRGEVY
jgi:hypothetical protein